MSQPDGERSAVGRHFSPLRLALPVLLVAAAAALIASSASAAPTVAILTPSDGAVINSGTVGLGLDIQNLTLNGAAVGQAAVAGEGHYHLYLDGAYMKFDYTTATFLNNVAAGSHAIRVELAENDHTELGINATVNVTISAGAPRVRILAPGDSASWGSSSAELQIWKENFTYNPAAVGQTAVAGEGHYHVYVNGGYFYFGTTEFFNATYLSIGQTNVIRIELANNDHTLLGDPAFDEIRLTVPAGVPEIKIDPALFQASVNASSLTAAVAVGNFTIDAAAIGSAAVAGRGHYHVWLDGVLLGPTAAPSVVLTDLLAGPHMLVVELRNNDHTPLTPRVVDWEPFTVLNTAPRIEMLEPSASASIGLNFTAVLVQVEEFLLVNKAGLPAVTGEGHWHVIIDGAYQGQFTGTAGVAIGLTAGTHTIRAELRNNDHTALTWPAFDEVTVTVVGARPIISIVTPTAGAIAYGTELTVTVSVANFTLAPGSVGQAAVYGEGHWHAFVDETYSGNSATSSVTLTGLTAGNHAIRVQLFNNDHTALALNVSASVSVVVAAMPAVTITSPGAGAATTDTTVTVSVQLANFTLDPVGTTANVAGHGHVHVYLDGALADMVATTDITLRNLTVGAHTIQIVLANNDHSELAGSGTSSNVTVTVNAAPPPPPAKGFLPGLAIADALLAAGAAALAVALIRRRR